MKTTDLAYAAGAIDADGCISIKRSTQRMRTTKDCRNPIYSPRISLGQVTPQVPNFLRTMFGGLVYTTKPGTRNSRPLYRWQVSDRSAFAAAGSLLPFLKIKSERAQALIELQEIKAEGGRLSVWYAKQNPDWHREELVTVSECAVILGSRTDSIHQAVSFGTLLCARNGRTGNIEVPRIPKAFAIELSKLKGTGKRFIACQQFILAQHSVWERVAAMNKLGISGTCVNHRTGSCTPAG